ncbi:unnamed protein product [Peronospora belbahrii]|uniref:AN1-type domain-containing protein n=1 Tax=Peronospora belbahrii TaxID=622444 RepID=A0AAU9KQ88_9STRA|nr:unnamed protein product [Peronospora belbahrii]CAH0521521.1 unnamed protein product [Peronospora belbahrii]
MDIGAHCSVPACHQQDFLPFTCDCCNGVFCLEHRSYNSHECPRAGSHDQRVVQCPVCKQLIHWTAEQDVNIVWEEHVRIGQCTREKFKQQQLKQQQKKPKKKRCLAEGCREVLLTSNQFHCRKCSQDVCLKHRFEADHGCESTQKAHKQQWLGDITSRKSSGSLAKQSSPFPKNAQKAAASIVNGTKSAVLSLVQNTKAVKCAMTTNSETCPMCHKQFNYETASASAVSSHATVPTTASTVVSPDSEMCPQCRAVFPTLSALIKHAETAHTGSVAASGDQEKCTMM